jgi:hypothetical protein
MKVNKVINLGIRIARNVKVAYGLSKAVPFLAVKYSVVIKAIN